MLAGMILVPTVRLATPADARAIAELSREAIEHGLGWTWTRQRVLKCIGDRSTNVAVADEQGRVLGFGIMKYGDDKAHLSLFGVQSIHRKRGVGSLLLAWLEKCAAVAGNERIGLEARSDNEIALAFYAKQGYRPIGTATGYYHGQVDAVRLEKNLGTSSP